MIDYCHLAHNYNSLLLAFNIHYLSNFIDFKELDWEIDNCLNLVIILRKSSMKVITTDVIIIIIIITIVVTVENTESSNCYLINNFAQIHYLKYHFYFLPWLFLVLLLYNW